MRAVKAAGPHSLLEFSRIFFFSIIITIRHGPTRFDHGPVEIGVARQTCSEQTVVTVPFTAGTRNATICDQFLEKVAGHPAAGVIVPISFADLVIFRRVNTLQAHPFSLNHDRITVSNRGAPFNWWRLETIDIHHDQCNQGKDGNCHDIVGKTPGAPAGTRSEKQTLNHWNLGCLSACELLSIYPTGPQPLPQAETADKIIVDRRKRHRNTEVSRAVRKTRDRLSQKVGNPAFDRELLKLHARAMVTSATAIPLLVTLIAAGGFLAGMASEILIWALITVTCYTGLAFVARQTDRTEAADIDVVRTKRKFMIAHFVTGIGWAHLMTLDCSACGIAHFQIIQGVLLLMVIAAGAILGSALNGGLLVTFALPVMVFSVNSASYDTPVDIAIIGLLILSLPFFARIGSYLNQSTIMLLSFRSEKDGLIAELETAKSMSDEARRRAEEANMAKSRFLASMSHELRTPLNAILGFSEVMANEVLGPIENETYRDYASDIHDSGQHLLNLINEILDLSRIEAGRYQINEEAIKLTHIAEDCSHMMALKLQGKDLRVVQQYEENLPQIWADERAVRQVVLNLLSNAVKFAPTGGEITLLVGWTAGGGQYVSVRDNGPGIPEEEIPVVLSAFGQGSIAIKSAEQGTGLGLPIVQALMHMHDGEFVLKSKLREGTEAIAIFPPARIMEELPAIPTKPPSARKSA